MNESACGTHLLADLYGIAADCLSHATGLEAILREAAQAAGARVLESRFHSFGSGQGVTGVLLLAESHISIHTWPESGFAAVDIFMCGTAQPELALDSILKSLAPAHEVVTSSLRGKAIKNNTSAPRIGVPEPG